MSKKIFYLTGTFRCGTTLLRSILNQNPDFYVTPNSILPNVFWLLDRFKKETSYKNWKKVDVDKQYLNSEKYYDNIIKNIFNNYFSEHKQKYILEQGRWGTLDNFNLLKKYNLLPAKFILLVRPFDEILSSWIRVDNVSNDSIYQYCNFLMSPMGQIGQAALALKFLVDNHKNNLLIIKYKDLCKQPEKTIKKIYRFLNVPYYKKHRFNNLNQVDISGSMHTTIRTKEIKQIHYNDLKIPTEIVKMYKKERDLFNKYG